MHIHSETRTWHVITYNKMHRTDKYSQHCSIIWPVWLNGWVFVCELSGCGFGDGLSVCVMNLLLKLSTLPGMKRVEFWSKPWEKATTMFEVSTNYFVQNSMKQPLKLFRVLCRSRTNKLIRLNKPIYRSEQANLLRWSTLNTKCIYVPTCTLAWQKIYVYA